MQSGPENTFHFKGDKFENNEGGSLLKQDQNPEGQTLNPSYVCLISGAM